LPAGRLREFRGALARAHVRVAVVGSADSPVAEADFVARRRPLGWTLLDGSPSDPPRRALLVSGIARPERFAADARALGSEIVAHRARPDHHRFTAAEIEAFAREAQELGADSLLTTAKDAVRWPPVVTPVPTRVLQMALEVDGEAALMERVMSVTKRAA
jgi:tetraacyldisaccharide 4'-kinase